MKKRTILIGVVAAICATTLVSCSTQKANWGNIQYHNTTAHYNVWWNGNESLKQGLALLDSKCKDDYTRLLPVYKVGTKEESMSLYPQFDRAIEKSIKGIKKHSIFVNGQEHVPYISRCYLLTAYATFYKHDLANSASTCQLLMSQYSGTAIADEAAILYARCATLDRRYLDAENSLDELVTALGKGNFASKQKLNLYLAMAECTLPQEKYKKGVQFLKLALDEHPTGQQKARIYYILGQIYQELDKRPTASKYYEKVLRCNPTYEMEFNARLNLASCADLQHTDREKLERLLDRMLHDKKNEEFLDQIYYAKGEMYMGMRETKKACEAFRTSTAVSVSNPAQKARSALRLGDILYSKLQDYDHAQIYYDTAMQIIKPDFPHYADHKSRHHLLTSLVTYTRVIQRNDSLIRVANMPESERMALINDKIEALAKAEAEAKERELLEQFANDARSQQNTLQGDWYFYNSNTVQKGKETFRQRWGMRPLEDYWFLSKKGMLGINMLAQNNTPTDEESEEDDGSTPKQTAEGDDKKAADNPNDPHNVAYYLKQLPKSQAEQDSMQAQTAICLLNAGYIYYDGIHNIPKALECYLRMADSYTTHSDIVQAFFMLYKIYDKQGNTPNANYYRNMVLMGFPDSDFANLILDEDYYKEIMRRSQLIREDYNDVYTLYRKHRYDEVLNAVATAKELYSNEPMLGKFRYWEALSYARLDNKSRAVATLQGIIADYPKTDSIVPLAQAQLDFLLGEGAKYVTNSGVDETVTDPNSIDEKVNTLASRDMPQVEQGRTSTSSESLPPEARLFRYKADMAHHVIIIVKEKKIRATQLQAKVGTFITTYYANSGYKTSPLMFTDSTQMVTISTFVNASEAKDFARHLQLADGPLTDYDKNDYQVFAISKQNYTTLYNRKQVEAYRQFYDKYYIQ